MSTSGRFASPPHGRPRVLLVAEDAIICRLIQRGLADAYEIVDVGSAAEALAMLHARDGFRVVVFDDHLEDGATLHERLIAEHPGLARRSVVMSRTRRAPATPPFPGFAGTVIEKPFDLAELATAIDAAGRA